MKLYYSPGACSLASHIALYETGLPFEAVKVEGRAQKKAGGEDYASVTAKNYVPALRLDDGQVLTEGTAILPYVADRKPESGLAPAAGTIERYRLHEWLGYINSEVHKNFGPFFAPGTTDEQKAAAKANLGKRFDFVQAELGDKPFCSARTSRWPTRISSRCWAGAVMSASISASGPDSSPITRASRRARPRNRP